MITLVISNKSPKEMDYMKKYSQQLVLELSDDSWSYYYLTTQEELKKFQHKEMNVDLVCIDVTMPSAIVFAEYIRKMSPESFMVLVADVKISPMKYIKPSIVAQSLLLRPYTAQQLYEILKEAFVTYLKAYQNETGEERFVIETREGRQLIPYEQIYYFEARDKKIIVNLNKVEYSFYSSLEEIQEKLPQRFLRCHRGFIINKNKIKSVKLSQSIITLSNDMLVPLSRTYKSVFKEIV